MITELGGFQEAAKLLTELSGQRWSRQRVEQMANRRNANGFPRMHTYIINGYTRELFNLQQVRDWYAFVEAAEVLTIISDKQYKPSEVYQLWRQKDATNFPQRVKRRDRLLFDQFTVAEWYRINIQDKDAGKQQAP